MVFLHRSATLPLLVLCAVMFSASIVPFAEAGTSLGSVTGKRTAGMASGGEVQFKIFLFNGGSSDITAFLDVDVPTGWNAAISPEVVPLRPAAGETPEDGYQFLSTASGYIKAREVLIDVRSPVYAASGTYEINATALVGEPGGTLSMMQSRSFHFAVEVEGQGVVVIGGGNGTDLPQPEGTGQNASPANETDRKGQPGQNLLFLAAVTAGIIALSFALFKIL